MNPSNISPDWRGSTRAEKRAIAKILEHEETPRAIQVFARESKQLGDYWYWFTLSTLWVQYTGFSELDLWRRLFRAKRPNRLTSLMKPDELEMFNRMPEKVLALRAHRPGEQDWIAYTLDAQIAARFAAERGVERVAMYEIPREKVYALFLRRGEKEILVLDPRDATFLGWVMVIREGSQPALSAAPLLTPTHEK